MVTEGLVVGMWLWFVYVIECTEVISIRLRWPSTREHEKILGNKYFGVQWKHLLFCLVVYWLDRFGTKAKFEVQNIMLIAGAKFDTGKFDEHTTKWCTLGYINWISWSCLVLWFAKFKYCSTTVQMWMSIEMILTTSIMYNACAA